MEPVSDETRTLRRTMRDLVALSALPAVWAGYEPRQVAEGLADVLLSTLRLDLVYLRLPGQAEGPQIEIGRTAGRPATTDETRNIGRALAPCLDDGFTDSTPSMLNPAGGGAVSLLIVRIGSDREDGVLAAGSQQPGFPSEADRLLLTVGANQAAAVLQRQRAETALRESEERFRNLLLGLPAAVYTTDRQGRITLFNDQAAKLWGRRPDIGKDTWCGSWRIFQPDGTPVPHDQCSMAVALHGDPSRLSREVIIERPDGTQVCVLAHPQPLCDTSGEIVGAINTLVDITERKQAEEAIRESNDRFRIVTKATNDAVWDWALSTNKVWWNEGVLTLFGYLLENNEADPAWWLERIHPDDRAAVEGFFFEVVRGNELSWVHEYRFRCADGSYKDVYDRGYVLRNSDGGAVRMIGAMLDITARKRAEEALRESEHRWRSLTEALPQLVWSATPDGACDYFSNQWTAHTGIPESDLLGWRWLAVLHPDDREPTRRFWTDSVAGRGPYDVEYRVRRRDGVYRWFKTRGVPIRDSAGNIGKWFGTCTDITELREIEQALRESEERFRGTFENAAVGIAHIDVTGRFLRVNEKLCEIVGYTREELLAKTFQDITYAADLEADLEQFMLLVRGDVPSTSRDKRYVRKDGSPVWVAVAVSLQRDAAGRPLNTISVIRDITARKRLEGELRHAKEVAEAANRAKDEFLANVSHEIRTPMNAILGMTELALDTPLTEDQRQSLRTVKSAGDNLLGIINDLLDFAKIEAGKLELDPGDFSVRAALGDTLRALAVRAHTKGLELVCQVAQDVPDSLVGDAGRLRQVLLNVVGNALKFTEEGEVVVRVEMVSGEAVSGKWSEAEAASVMPHALPVTTHSPPLTTHLRFTVRDTGIGIPQEKQEKIFRAFEQEDTSTTRKYGGTGLGLTIAARLVSLMGGTINVASQPDRGSTFTFTARFGRQPHRPASVAAQPPVLLRNLPVLIVDDNATNRRILEEWLRGWQMKPVAVGDGVAAMDALWHGMSCGRPYALVLLDARMPDTDGLALAAQIRQRAQLSATHIILLTSGDRPSDLARFRQQRVNAHLLKPVQQDELLETIYRVISRTNGDVPPQAQAAVGRERVPPPAAAAMPLRILVAEDNEFNAQHLEQLLVRRGHRARLANNGREAMALAEEGGFDVLLLDIHMPELDGFQVAQAIRERERAAGGHLPVIALTARSRQEDRERCLAAGMDDFLAKPVRAADLWAAIDRVVAVRLSADRPNQRLLDPRVLLAVCGGDDGILHTICQSFRARLPDQLTAVEDAWRAQDAPRLREAAHRLSGILAAFSTSAGAVTSSLEEQAAGARLDECRPLVEQLETMCRELMQQVNDLSIETLQGQAETGREPNQAGAL